ncbi:MAG: hypothetical protein A2021_02895 [Elusimicrobia bacterium GWF2_52_66]|nr:MAG: hypothetical protein A2021_02895 [Elusimicrobia bacterium GWF2_52_66]HAF95499.1 hypothetical protein [Elusimicrobiota bacterium]HCE98811.1 hypothetical protein [Elusimicrobiota bacterium]
MQRIAPLLFSVSLVFTLFAETTHNHKEACDIPCPAVCLGSSGGAYCDNPDSRLYAAPAEPERPAVFGFETVFIPRLLEAEIFHPPAV